MPSGDLKTSCTHWRISGGREKCSGRPVVKYSASTKDPFECAKTREPFLIGLPYFLLDLPTIFFGLKRFAGDYVWLMELRKESRHKSTESHQKQPKLLVYGPNGLYAIPKQFPLARDANHDRRVAGNAVKLSRP